MNATTSSGVTMIPEVPSNSNPQLTLENIESTSVINNNILTDNKSIDCSFTCKSSRTKPFLKSSCSVTRVSTIVEILKI